MTSPIRPTSPGATRPTQATSPEREAPRVGQARPATDVNAPAARRQRTEGGRIDMPQRQALPLQPPPARELLPRADSLASMGHFSELGSFGAASTPASPGSPGVMQAQGAALGPSPPPGTPTGSLDSVHDLGPVEDFDAYVAVLTAGVAAAQAASRAPPSHASGGAGPSWPAAPSASGASLGRAPRAAGLDEAEFAPGAADVAAIEYHPERVQADDVQHVENFIRLLGLVGAGEAVTHVRARDRAALFAAGFDSTGWLHPRNANPNNRLVHEKLDRLAEGGPEHRALRARLDTAMHEAGQRFHEQTADLMQVVMAACEEVRTTLRPVSHIAKDLEDQGQTQAAYLVRYGVLANSGVFKAPEHNDSHSIGLRGRVIRLAEHGGAQYATLLSRWREFEVEQRPAALAAANGARSQGPRGPKQINFDAKFNQAQQFVELLGRMERDGEKLKFLSGAQKLTAFEECFDHYGGLTDKGHAHLAQLRQSPDAAHVEQATAVEQASAAAVQAALQRIEADVRQLTSSVLRIKEGKTKNSVVEQLKAAWELEPVAGQRNPASRLATTVDAYAVHFLDNGTAQTLATQIRKLSENLEAGETHPAVAELGAAMMRPHAALPFAGVADPIAELLGRPLRAARAQAQARAQAPAAAAGAARPPRTSRAPRAGRGRAAAGRGAAQGAQAAQGAAAARPRAAAGRAATPASPAGSVGSVGAHSLRAMSPPHSAQRSGIGAGFDPHDEVQSRRPASPRFDVGHAPTPQWSPISLPGSPAQAGSARERPVFDLNEPSTDTYAGLASLSEAQLSPGRGQPEVQSRRPSSPQFPQGAPISLPGAPQAQAGSARAASPSVNPRPTFDLNEPSQDIFDGLASLSGAQLSPGRAQPEVQSRPRPEPEVSLNRPASPARVAVGGSHAAGAGSSQPATDTQQWLSGMLRGVSALEREQLLDQALMLDAYLGSLNLDRLPAMVMEQPDSLLTFAGPYRDAASRLIDLAQQRRP